MDRVREKACYDLHSRYDAPIFSRGQSGARAVVSVILMCGCVIDLLRNGYEVLRLGLLDLLRAQQEHWSGTEMLDKRGPKDKCV